MYLQINLVTKIITLKRTVNQLNSLPLLVPVFSKHTRTLHEIDMIENTLKMQSHDFMTFNI